MEARPLPVQSLALHMRYSPSRIVCNTSLDEAMLLQACMTRLCLQLLQVRHNGMGVCLHKVDQPAQEHSMFTKSNASNQLGQIHQEEELLLSMGAGEPQRPHMLTCGSRARHSPRLWS